VIIVEAIKGIGMTFIILALVAVLLEIRK